MSNSTQFSGDAQFQPNDSDWAEYNQWLDSLESGQQFPDEPEPTRVQWAAHVNNYLADHHLDAAPF